MRIGWFLLFFVIACENDPPPTRAEPPAPAKAKAGKIEFVVPGPEADLSGFIRDEAVRATSDGKMLVVYVGAPWCEPCVRFHKAAEAGQLDEQFPNLRFVELDRDKDEARLAKAACLSQLIPLFAKPDADGRCSAKGRLEGSIKGEGAVAEITPRLTRLIHDRTE